MVHPTGIACNWPRTGHNAQSRSMEFNYRNLVDSKGNSSPLWHFWEDKTVLEILVVTLRPQRGMCLSKEWIQRRMNWETKRVWLNSEDTVQASGWAAMPATRTWQLWEPTKVLNLVEGCLPLAIMGTAHHWSSGAQQVAAVLTDSGLMNGRLLCHRSH